jgi:flavin-dependent dehydrogenase
VSASWDVIVVGGGPAGATAARGLARGGVRVAVIEKDTPPRYKTCGGGVVGRARRLLPVGTDAVFESECREVAMGVGELERTFAVRRDEPIVSMSMRARLDHALLSAATAAGAVLISPSRARSLAQDSTFVTVGTDDGPLRARFVVAGDGATGTTARLAGWSEPLHAAPALEWELPAPPALMRRFGGVARFDFEPALAGYAWVFPKREHLSVGVLSVRRGRASLVRAAPRSRATAS